MNFFDVVLMVVTVIYLIGIMFMLVADLRYRKLKKKIEENTEVSKKLSEIDGRRQQDSRKSHHDDDSWRPRKEMTVEIKW